MLKISNYNCGDIYYLQGKENQLINMGHASFLRKG